MKITLPFEPVSAARPNWNTTTGRVNSRSYMPIRYRKWRRMADEYIENWLKERDYQPINELIYLNPEKQIKARENGVFSPYFYGYKVKILVVLPQVGKNTYRAFPLSTRQADIDNYSKAVIDAVFQSETFKRAKIDDRFIQDLHSKKRCCMPNEEPRTEIEIEMIRGDLDE